jgi:hypothetical protein
MYTSKFFKIVTILAIFQMLSSIQVIPGASATPTKPFVTAQFCKDSFKGRELEYCECHVQADASWQVKERCMKNVVTDYHVDLFTDTLKAQKDIADGKIQHEAVLLKRRQNFQSYTTMCELIYSKAAGRAATCACDAYDYFYEGAANRANCVHAASQLKANDVAKEEFAGNQKPLCNFVASIKDSAVSTFQTILMPTAMSLPTLIQIPVFITGVQAVWAGVFNPWTLYLGGATAVVAGGVYINQCVLQ